jgi:malate dehydrogenase (oxaloacetate-decarboxylating)
MSAVVTALEGFELKTAYLTEDVIVYCESEAHQQEVLAAVEGVEGAEVLEWEDRTFALHTSGKIQVDSSVEIRGMDDLAMAYSPGVARVCSAIAADRELSHEYTIRKNTVAIVSDGTAVLGPRRHRPHAAMPVMEGKALLFKHFAGVDAFPICLDTKDPDEIVDLVTEARADLRRHQPRGHRRARGVRHRGAPGGGARHPRVPRRPARHGDRDARGTRERPQDRRQAARQPQDRRRRRRRRRRRGERRSSWRAGVDNIIGVDRGARARRARGPQLVKQWFAENTNPEKLAGTISDVIRRRGRVHRAVRARPAHRRRRQVDGEGPDRVRHGQPRPEIRPELIQDIAAVIATGRSDFPNQINNVLAFPGIFRGAVRRRAPDVITENMKVAAARAIAEVVGDEAHRTPLPGARHVCDQVVHDLRRGVDLDGLAVREGLHARHPGRARRNCLEVDTPAGKHSRPCADSTRPPASAPR